MIFFCLCLLTIYQIRLLTFLSIRLSIFSLRICSPEEKVVKLTSIPLSIGCNVSVECPPTFTLTHRKTEEDFRSKTDRTFERFPTVLMQTGFTACCFTNLYTQSKFSEEATKKISRYRFGSTNRPLNGIKKCSIN